ncbi:YcfL family protein [Vibrio sp. LaRot3]|uniref:YcfL family protein n=1 Tax=Vibrio sp. LaRot3 TaxID=2998829 RepID=UPI0022CE1B2A|nr:DUF1425 domain-containing protein [Vibrio sp. LaRot3]MDA0147850.1 DUF1425 domain-containing protein [Vibrio sp. LaRot3]
MKKWILAIMATFAVVGCSSNTSGLRIDGGSQSVLFANSSLDRRLAVEDITTTEMDGHTRGIVSLASKSSGDQHLLYRFYWYDDQGLEVDTKVGNWKRLIIRGEEILTISEVAVNPNATQFRVQIREQD